MIKKIAALLWVIWLLLWPQVAFAQSTTSNQAPKPTGTEFSTSYDVIYDVGEDGITNVTQKIGLKNLTSNFFASKYTLIIGSTTLSDVAASDPQGPLTVKPDIQGNRTQIEIKFNQQIAGEGKTQNFTLKFKSKDFALDIWFNS